MLQSMTGFGSGFSQKGGVSATVEIRTVNHRFLDLHIRLSREYVSLESEIQQAVRNSLSRGRVDVSVTIQSAAPAELLVNADLARGYSEAARKLREELKLTDSLDLRTLLALPGVVQNKDSLTIAEGAQSELKEAVKESLRAALAGVVQMRVQEGQALKSDMAGHLARISEKAARARTIVPSTVQECQARLQEKLEQLLPPKVLDPQRLAQEVAILAERSDISEEFARLESHIDQFGGLLGDGAEIGKRLDFLLQEMQREVNTMLSKSGNLEITSLGIAMKAEIEKLREQVQNVE
jgi:uncharacterized protein (TIGR00255 family)